MTCILLCFSANAQINTTFDDSSAWHSAWWGDTSAFTCHNGHLQLNADPSLGLARIASNSSAHNQGQFYGKVSLEFNPSSMNHMVLDLVKGVDFTYSLIIGKEEDKVQWKYTASDEEVVLLESLENYLLHPQIHLEFWLNFDSLGYWHLMTRLLDDLAIDSGFVQYWGNHHFVRGGLATELGIECVYTSSRADKFFVDALYIKGQPFQDVFPPRILSFSLQGVRQIQVRASEEVFPSQVVSLNGDGVLDVLEVQLTDNVWSQGGYRIDVFSMAGHHCKQIAYAEVGGAKDHWYWDGSTEDGGVLPPDFYILTMQGLSGLSPPRCSVPILVMY